MKSIVALRTVTCFLSICLMAVGASAQVDPVIMGGPTAGTFHAGVDGGGEEYGLNLNVSVDDPQGLANIASVTVTGPDGSTIYTLYDDGNHCDGPPTDGFYSLQCGGNDPDPPAEGNYTFTIEDADGHSVSQTVARSSVILDIPRNLSPANNAVVGSLTPTFSWDAVAGATGYDMEVRNPSGWQWMWSKNGFTSTSVVYNDDSAGNPLAENTIYQWGVGAHDDQGNNSWHHTANSFIYSTGDKPAFTQAWVGGRERLNEQGFHEYAIHLQATVFDPQGLSDIASVVVTGPDNATYTLKDDGMNADNGPGDGVYGVWVDWRSSPFAIGTYSFTVTDNNSNTSTITDTLEDGSPLPTNLSPADGEVLFAAPTTFSWVAPDSPNGWIQVMDAQHQEIWSSGVTGTSIAYGGPAFEPGKPYRWEVAANDTVGNSGNAQGLFIYYPSRKVADTWYDRFDEPSIDRMKWGIWYDQRIQAREIVDGELRLDVESNPSTDQRVNLHMTETALLTQLEAKVLVESGTVMQNGAWGYARIAGTFYNENRGPDSGNDYDGFLDDVWVELKLKTTDTEGKLKANAYVERSANADFSQGTALFNQDLPTLLDYDTAYVLKITLQQSPNQIVFDCNGEQTTFALPETIYEPNGRDYKLRTRVYANGDQYGYMRARYDDVYIDKGSGRELYDDFSSTYIDLSKWNDPEDVREIKDGQLRMVTFGAEQRTTVSIPAHFYNTDYIEAKITLESGGYLDGGIRSIARISGNFYNDTYGPGQYNGDEGEVWATIYLNQYGSGSPIAKFYAERADDPAWSTYTELLSGDFTTPIELDREYRTSIEMTGTELIFKLDDETITYDIQTSVNPTNSTWRSLQTRVYAEPGKSGIVKALFDDVRVWKRQYGVDDVITVLKTLTGQTPPEIVDIDNFAAPPSIGTEDSLYILQNVGGIRNWP